MLSLKEKIKEAVDFIRLRTERVVDIGMILGSGLGGLADEVEDAVHIGFSDIPYFPHPTVEGHAGFLVIGRLSGKSVAVLKGRVHYYEGYSIQDVTFPVRLFKALGAKVFFVTNASGGINRNFVAGDLMLITDHINLMGVNPLIGQNEPDLGPRFPDMTNAYDIHLRELALESARDLGIPLKEGVFTAVSGPNYETLAEVRFLERIGADAVGMSTVPEVIVARHAGLRVIGISCVTDVIFLSHGVSHEEVLEVANRMKPKFTALVKEIIKRI